MGVMMTELNNKARGDTIIEVLLAVTIFSMVAVGSMVIMNKGLATAQRSLEITQVRHQIDGQAEMLRYVHSQTILDSPDEDAVAIWGNINKEGGEPESIMGVASCPSSFPENGFVLTSDSGLMTIGLSQQSNGGTYRQPATYARVDEDGSQGISVQLARADEGRAYDAYIQACWDSPGLNQPMTIGTIVRLYDPEA